MNPAQRFFGMYVDGGYRPAQSGNAFAVENPKDCSVVAEVAEGGAADIDAAVAAARNALPGWSSLSGAQRGDLMHRAADALALRLPELVDVEIDQTGRPRCEMAAQLARLPEWFRYFGAVARTHEDTVPPFGGNFLNYTRRVPLGVVGHITPWNHPLLILTKKVAPSMAAGNTMVVKPSELAPITALLLGEVLKEAGIPDGTMRIAQEEIFGPLVCVMAFDTEEEAVALANGTVYGLAASVWTRDLARAHRVAGALECGVTWINDHHRIDPASPWGGFRMSGIGRENGLVAYEDYTQIRNVIVNLSDAPFDWYAGDGAPARYS